VAKRHLLLWQTVWLGVEVGVGGTE